MPQQMAISYSPSDLPQQKGHQLFSIRYATTKRPSAILHQIIIIIIIYTTYIAPYIWPVWPFIGAEEGPSKY